MECYKFSQKSRYICPDKSSAAKSAFAFFKLSSVASLRHRQSSEDIIDIYERGVYCCRHFNAIRLRISGAPGPSAGAAGGGGEAAATCGTSVATAAGATPVARYAPPAARLWQVRIFILLRFIQI